MADFQRKQLSDATWDSVCQRCFTTVANKSNEEDLVMAEEMHDCTLPNERATELQ